MSIETVAAAKALLSPVVRRLAGSVGETLSAEWQKIDWIAREGEYRQRVISQLNTIKLLGRSHEISLDQVFTDVYVLTTPKKEVYWLGPDDVRGDEQFRLMRAKTLGERCRFDDFAEHRRLYILGAPGAGKTTLLRHLAIRAARGLVDRIPVLVSMREAYQAVESIDDALIRSLILGGVSDPRLILGGLLEAGSLMLLFDGLDEVPTSKGDRQKYLSQAISICKLYPKCQVVISCRTAAGQMTLEGFRYLELAEFDDGQQTSYVRQWFAGDSTSHSQFSAGWLQDSNKSLRELASTPLLLALLCTSFQATRSFPRKRIELFHDAVNALIFQWDASRGVAREGEISALDVLRKKQLLQSIAYHTFQNAEYVFDEKRGIAEISRYLSMLPDIEPTIRVSPIHLQELAANQGLIVERAVRLFSFSHLSIQEYLTACYLLESPTDAERSRFRHFEILSDNRWAEVSIFLCSLMPNATEFVARLIEATRTVASGSLSMVDLLERVASSARSASETRVLLEAVRNIAQPDESIDETSALRRQTIRIAAKAQRIDSNASSDFFRRLVVWDRLFTDNRAILALSKSDDPRPASFAGTLDHYFSMVELVVDCLAEASLSRRREELLSELLT